MLTVCSTLLTIMRSYKFENCVDKTRTNYKDGVTMNQIDSIKSTPNLTTCQFSHQLLGTNSICPHIFTFMQNPCGDYHNTVCAQKPATFPHIYTVGNNSLNMLYVQIPLDLMLLYNGLYSKQNFL